MCYYGTGCFHRRETLSGQIYSKDYKEDWARGVGIAENADELEETSKSLVTCTYEHNTPWGIEVSLSLSTNLNMSISIDPLLFNEYIQKILQ
jgi:hypothetical protein